MEVESEEMQNAIKEDFFSQRVIRSWNKLLEHVVDASSINSLKKRLDDWLEDVDI